VTAGGVARALEFLRDGRIPVREHTYRPLELFLFSAATWNPHRVHYDQDYTRSVAGHPDLLVQGPLQAAHMFGLLVDALADGVSVRELEYRHLSVLHAGEPVRIGGELTTAGQTGATAQMWVARASGQQTTTGVAQLALAAGTAAPRAPGATR
jgi:3-methylfumaryl-CoA hydratase